jgi:hypothetical protein
MTAGYSTLTSEGLREEIAAIRRMGKKVSKSRTRSRALLVKAGIITKDGKLAARYRSKG